MMHVLLFVAMGGGMFVPGFFAAFVMTAFTTSSPRRIAWASWAVVASCGAVAGLYFMAPYLENFLIYAIMSLFSVSWGQKAGSKLKRHREQKDKL